MTLLELADAIAKLPVSTSLAGISWFVPTVQSIHIFAIAIVFTSVTIFTVRVAGLVRLTEPAKATIRRFMPWIYFSLTLLLVSGSLLTLIEPHRQLLNPYFQIKMLLLLLFLLVLAGGVRITAGVDRDPPREGTSYYSLRSAGFLAVSVLLAIIWCGRWIAYSQ